MNFASSLLMYTTIILSFGGLFFTFTDYFDIIYNS